MYFITNNKKIIEKLICYDELTIFSDIDTAHKELYLHEILK